MNLFDLRNEATTLRPPELKKRVVKAFNEFGYVLSQMDPSVILLLVEQGLLDPLIDLEAEDVFGTEGMSL